MTFPTDGGMSVRLDDAEARALLGDLLARLGDLSRPMAAIGQHLVTEADLAFRRERDPWGEPWEPLAASTLRQRRSGRRRGARAARVLQDTGRLRSSLAYRADASGVSVGTNVRYARIHQLGGTIERAGGMRTLYFRMSKSGEVGNRFVKKSRSNFAQDVQTGPSQVEIPARPYLPIRDGRVDLPPATAADIRDLIAQHWLDGAA